ncbi:MAG: agmatine deiminase [Steroidobacteraceae bacterium]
MTSKAASLAGTPKADGFWMPGEFERHSGCWMLWPERYDNWREQALPAQRAFALVAAAISRFERVTIGVSAAAEPFARAALLPRIRVQRMPSDDAWMRDVGPTIVVNAAGERRGVHWRFNAWGGIYTPCKRDQQVARQVLELEGLARYRAPFINEGGAIHSDGEGTLLVTEQCLLNPNRNPKLSRARIEKLLLDYTGAEKVLWLGAGVINDETGGHIDNLACFARPGEVCLTWTDNRRDRQYRVCADALERLTQMRDARGRSLIVHQLPSPGPLYMEKHEARGLVQKEGIRPLRAGLRLAGSYVNFYLANGGVVVPLLDESTDEAALQKLRAIFPEREVVGVPAREILLGGGNIHCITQQIPAPRKRSRSATSQPAKNQPAREKQEPA